MAFAEKGWALLVSLGLGTALLGCGDGDAGDSGDTTTDSGTTTTEVAGHHLGLDVTLTAGADGKLSFLTPSNTIVGYDPSEIVGKPTLIATFQGGVSLGNDPAIELVWGEMPESLEVHFTSAQTYEDGPYDVVFVCYKSSAITQEMIDGTAAPPAAMGGDLASFVLKGDILDGDPKNALGTIRINVAGADASVSLENRTPMDHEDADQVAAAFQNTVLTIP